MNHYSKMDTKHIYNESDGLMLCIWNGTYGFVLTKFNDNGLVCHFIFYN